MYFLVIACDHGPMARFFSLQELDRVISYESNGASTFDPLELHDFFIYFKIFPDNSH